jgi:hypothetical protein
LGKLKNLGITKRPTSKDKWDLNKTFLLKKIGKSIEKSKIEYLVTLLPTYTSCRISNNGGKNSKYLEKFSLTK